MISRRTALYIFLFVIMVCIDTLLGVFKVPVFTLIICGIVIMYEALLPYIYK